MQTESKTRFQIKFLTEAYRMNRSVFLEAIENQFLFR